jgi:hypothetical protein
MRRIILTQGHGLYLILDRPGEKEWDKIPRADDKAILVNVAEGYRVEPWPLGSYLNHMPGWVDCGHNETIMADLLALPSRPFGSSEKVPP